MLKHLQRKVVAPLTEHDDVITSLLGEAPRLGLHWAPHLLGPVLLSRVMLIRLLTYVVDTVVPESQFGFRRARSTTDMIFVASLLQEKCREQRGGLFIAFIDLTKAFDIVNCDLL